MNELYEKLYSRAEELDESELDTGPDAKSHYIAAMEHIKETLQEGVWGMTSIAIDVINAEIEKLNDGN